MSVEIEVGLENAARARVPAGEEVKLEKAADPAGNPNLRRGLILGAVILLAAIVGLFFYYHNRESTDDAQVDGHITPIAAKISGRVGKVLVQDNQPVKAGELLVQIDQGDYQAALDQAKAALALAESEARSAGFDIPRTTEDVASGTSSADAQLAGAEADYARPRQPMRKHRQRTLRWHKRTSKKAARMLNSPKQISTVTAR